jgi:hypothetical protein
METANYIYIQLAESIHEDKPRILTASDNINKTIYIDNLTSEENAILSDLINKINIRLNNQ